MPAEFMCPQCGARTTARDQSADLGTKCDRCGQVIGNSDLPSPDFPPTRQGSGCSATGCAIAVCVAIALLVLFFAVMIPSLRNALQHARGMQCSNQMKQIAI